jgi:hypothetical protein
VNTKAIGATAPLKKDYGSFNSPYVTVFGAYVPVGFQPGVLVYLHDLGYAVKARGHAISVALSDTQDHVAQVRYLIHHYAKGTWTP